MPNSNDYTIVDVDPMWLRVDPEIQAFAIHVGETVGNKFNHIFDWKNFSSSRYINSGGRIRVCLRNKHPVGVMLARLYSSVFDPRVKIFAQDLLYAESGTRAVKLLMDDFIDFGKSHANHVMTCVTPGITNIKQRSLERLGFSQSESLYWMEI